MLKFTLFLVVSCVALSLDTVSSNPLDSTSPPEAAIKELVDILICTSELDKKSGCFDKLPPGIQGNSTNYDRQMTSDPEKLCCPSYTAIRCVVSYSEQAELCKKVLPSLKQSLDKNVKDLTDKYHCQLESCSV